MLHRRGILLVLLLLLERRLCHLDRLTILPQKSVLWLPKARRWEMHVVLLFVLDHSLRRQWKLWRRLLVSHWLLSGVARVRRLWLSYECVDLIHRRVWQACILLTLSATLQHSQQVVCLRHLRLLRSLLHWSISKSSDGQKSLEFL